MTMDDFKLPKIAAAGDSAVLIEFEQRISPEVNRRVHSLAESLRRAWLGGVEEIVPAYCSLLIHYDPLQLSFDQVSSFAQMKINLEEEVPEKPTRRIEIPTFYGGKFGPDLEEVARLHQLTTSDVIRIHSSKDYLVYMVGFTPGFAYLGEVDETIATPRLQTPRTLVPAGSVGIAGKQTGVYPIDSPGGWRIIGHSDLIFFDPLREPPSLLAPGDWVRFVPVTPENPFHDI